MFSDYLLGDCKRDKEYIFHCAKDYKKRDHQITRFFCIQVSKKKCAGFHSKKLLLNYKLNDRKYQKPSPFNRKKKKKIKRILDAVTNCHVLYFNLQQNQNCVICVTIYSHRLELLAMGNLDSCSVFEKALANPKVE